MKLHTLFIIGLVFGMVACAEKEQVAPETGDAPAAPTAAAPPAQSEPWQNQAFLDHMHLHADHLDELNISLADDDLDGALTPAYWLSRHEAVVEIPAEWQQFVEGMRAAAREVEEATDLETAKLAAAKITEQCQGCHTAAGILD